LYKKVFIGSPLWVCIASVNKIISASRDENNIPAARVLSEIQDFRKLLASGNNGATPSIGIDRKLSFTAHINSHNLHLEA